ncbi:MAG TPA: SMP-30/gluconolactonase/LRE family protein [Blastocatellia bacterium]|nr:SMP-30/gluconolactonase/LRE family protein [Blastocatellia bacterium]
MSKLIVPSKTVLVSMIVALFCGSALAVGPVFWEITKQDDVIKGDARGVSIAENGSITLAPSFNLVYDTREAYIWSSATDSAGNIFLGTGHEGRIFKVTPAGEGRLFYDAAELDVTAMVTDPQGNLYAGTSPNGKIYKITPDGKESVFYDPPDKYIWSLAFDSASSTLYAGTGDKGVIYKIDAAGKASVLADTNETNIVSLALDKSGNLLAGTDPSGLVLRISPAGKLFALFDSPMQEIHRLSFAGDGSLYALGVSPTAGAAGRGASIGTSSVTSLSTEGVITLSSGDDQEDRVSQPIEISLPSSQGQSRSKTEGARSVLFRILPDGGSDVLWRSNDTVGYGLKPLADGGVLVGTGSKGRIYQVGADRSHTLLIQSPEDQTSTIIAVGDNLYATSSNLGRLYRIGRDSVTEGTYVSPIRDTKFAGQWGVITWRGSGKIELQTRSGNTESPDATWSDWSGVYRNALGDQITSPKARFIQWRAVLRGKQSGAAQTGRAGGTDASSSAQLQSVVVAYLPRNQAPDISSVSVMAPGVALQEMPMAIDPSIVSSGLDPQLFGVATNVPPRRFFQKGARTLTWQASDPNDDTLLYKVFYRTLGEGEWHLLADGLSQTYYTIDGNRLPDGTYLFRIAASDEPSNTRETALADEQITDPIEVDNTPPAIKVTGPTISGQSAEVLFDATDATSRVVRGEYSVDGGAWQLIYPVDGIADSAHESFKVKVKFDKPGEHLIAFRCADSSSNVGSAKVTATVR